MDEFFGGLWLRPVSLSTWCRREYNSLILWFSQRLRKRPTALPAFFSELDCAIASTGGRAKNFALKNQIYCEFSNSEACQVLIKQRALKKKRIRNLLSSEFFATFRKSTISCCRALVIHTTNLALRRTDALKRLCNPYI